MAKNLLQFAVEWLRDNSQSTQVSTSAIDDQIKNLESQEDEYNKQLAELGHEKKRCNFHRDTAGAQAAQDKIDQMRQEKQALLKNKKLLNQAKPAVAEKEQQEQRREYYNKMQAERDKLSQQQSNNVGRNKNRQRDSRMGSSAYVRPHNYEETYNAKQFGS